MLHAKNYETASTSVKYTQRKLWLLFSGHGVYIVQLQISYSVYLTICAKNDENRLREDSHSNEKMVQFLAHTAESIDYKLTLRY